MAIDSINRVANTGYTSSASKVSTEAILPSEASKAVETQAATEASGVTVSTKQQATDNSDSNTEQNQTTMKDVSEISKVINRNTIAEFGYNEPTNRITIKIKDRETDEVIREIPSEKALEMIAKAWELAGIMVDEKR